jgi:hypothetical protein
VRHSTRQGRRAMWAAGMWAERAGTGGEAKLSAAHLRARHTRTHTHTHPTWALETAGALAWSFLPSFLRSFLTSRDGCTHTHTHNTAKPLHQQHHTRRGDAIGWIGGLPMWSATMDRNAMRRGAVRCDPKDASSRGRCGVVSCNAHWYISYALSSKCPLVVPSSAPRPTPHSTA